MKKNFFLVLALSLFVSANAQQVTAPTKEIKPVKLENLAAKKIMAKDMNLLATKQQTYTNGQLPTSVAPRQNVANATEIAFYLANPNYALYSGTTAEGYNYLNEYVLFPYTKGVDFFCITNSTNQFAWLIDNQQASDINDSIYSIPANYVQGPGYGMPYVPTLLFATGTSYTYGEEAKASVGTYALFDDYYWVTSKPAYTNPDICQISQVASPYNSLLIGYSDNCPYLLGTNMTYYFDKDNELQTGGATIDTVMTIFGFDNVRTDIDSISIQVWADDKIKLGNELTVTLFPMQGNSVYINSPIASEKVSSDFVSQDFSDGGQFGIINFPVKASVNGRFAIMISGLSDPNADFGFVTGQVDLVFAGTTLFIQNGEFSNNPWALDIALSVNAKFTEGATMAAPVVNENNANKAQKFVTPEGQVVFTKDGKTYNMLGVEL